MGDNYAEKWYHFEDEDLAIQVSTEGRPYKLRFYKGEAYEKFNEGEKDNLKNGDQVAPPLNPKGNDFLSSSWWKNKIKSTILDSPVRDFDEETAEDMVNRFAMVASDELKGMADEAFSGDDDDGPEEMDTDDGVDDKAKQLLRNPSLLLRLDDAFHEEMAIENRNAMLNFLNCITALTGDLHDPTNLDWSGRTSTGKTIIALTPLEFFPEHMVMDYIGLSKKTLFHDGKKIDENTSEVNFENKILVVLEKENSREALEQIKPILSHDKKVHTYKYAKEAGETMEVKMKGWPVFIGCTVEHEEDAELDTRSITATPEIGTKKYESVIDWKALRSWAPWEDENTEDKKEIIRRAVDLLDKENVWIPYIPELRRNFPDKSARHQRDWDRLVSIIAAVTLLHQYQRDSIIVKGDNMEDHEYLVATPFDAKVALDVLQGVLEQTMMGLERDVIQFFEELQERNKRAGTTKKWTYRELMGVHEDALGEEISYSQVRDRFVAPLKEVGAIDIDKSQEPHQVKATKLSLSDRFPDLKKMVKDIEDFDYTQEAIEERFYQSSKARGDNPGPDLKVSDSPDLNIETQDNVYGEFRRRMDTSTEGQEVDWSLGEGQDVMELDDILEEDEGEEDGMQDRLKNVIDFYEDRYKGEIPYLGDFVSVASSDLEYDEDQIREDCEHLENEGKLTFRREKLGDF